MKYSLREHGSTYKLSEHFTLGEFACHDGTDEVLINPKLVEILEEIRAWARVHIAPDATVHITSGYRTKKYNATVTDSASKSQHCVGNAADIKVKAFGGGWISPTVIHEALDKGEVSDSWVGGLGLYKSWVHVDVRGSKARWKG